MTPEREAEIRARLAAATPGPWSEDREGHNPGHWTIRCGRAGIAYGMSWQDPHGGGIAHPWPQGDANAVLITNAPQDFADLLAALDEARAIQSEQAAKLRRHIEEASDLRAECEALSITLDAALDDVAAEREACAEIADRCVRERTYQAPIALRAGGDYDAVTAKLSEATRIRDAIRDRGDNPNPTTEDT